MNILQFFRKKPKPVVTEPQPTPHSLQEIIKEAKREPTPEKRRRKAWELFHKYLEEKKRTNTYCFFADKLYGYSLITDIFPKTDDDTTNTSSLNT